MYLYFGKDLTRVKKATEVPAQRSVERPTPTIILTAIQRPLQAVKEVADCNKHRLHRSHSHNHTSSLARLLLLHKIKLKIPRLVVLVRKVNQRLLVVDE